MKKLMTISFVLALLMYAVAVAQYGAQQPDNSKSSVSMKAVSITGTISDDGKMFVSDKDSKSWTLSNPAAVKDMKGTKSRCKPRWMRTTTRFTSCRSRWRRIVCKSEFTGHFCVAASDHTGPSYFLSRV